MYEEGHGILYGDNVFEVKITSTYEKLTARLEPPIYTLDVVSDGVLHSRYSEDQELLHACTRWNGLLRKVHKLHIFFFNLQYQDATGQIVPADVFKGASDNLYSLCSFLSVGNGLKKIHLEVDASTLPNFDAIAKLLLWPLVKLPTPDIYEITGVSQQTTAHLLTQMRNREQPVANTFGNAKALHAKAKRLRDLLTEVGSLKGRKEAIAVRTNTMDSIFSMAGYMDEARDKWLEGCVKDLENLLRRGPDGGMVQEATREAKWKMGRLAQLCDELE